MNDDLELRVDGARPLTVEAIAAVGAVCDTAEDRGGRGRVVVYVSGAPDGPRPAGLTVAVVSKWERALRRLERLPAATVAVADGDCGGLALDALLATDHRIATESVRLVVPVEGGATWPGMAVYRLAHRAGSTAVAIRRAVLFGTPLPARDALALQLLDEVTDDVSAALAAAEPLGELSGPELAIRRQLLFDASTAGFEEALGVHLAACDRDLRRTGSGAVS
ncbi:enoyl-CoA-hydratase DpgB [Embleya sp. NPDC050154]|uniref:enoyl-CoA-hydratase DpgB n=1 Tax=Embleya sp. NPDC050154 TaxID=3363988 RepID=UPI0037B9B968